MAVEHPPAASPAANEEAPGCFGSILRIVLWISLGLLLLGVGVAIGLWWAATLEPEAYRQVMQASNPVAAKSGAQQLESQASVLAAEVKKPGKWQAIFSQAEVNGWLETVLPEKFPEHLPAGVTDPRVVIAQDRVTGFCRYYDGRVKTVVSLEVEAYLTERKNEVAVRLRGAKAGALPLPLAEVVDRVSSAAREAEVPLRWTSAEGDPVALVQLEPIERETRRPVIFHQLEVRAGEIYIRGETAAK